MEVVRRAPRPRRLRLTLGSVTAAVALSGLDVITAVMYYGGQFAMFGDDTVLNTMFAGLRALVVLLAYILVVVEAPSFPRMATSVIVTVLLVITTLIYPPENMGTQLVDVAYVCATAMTSLLVAVPLIIYYRRDPRPY